MVKETLSKSRHSVETNKKKKELEMQKKESKE